MNVQIAVPAHVGEDGVWLHFISPTTGKQSMVNMNSIIEECGSGIVADAMTEWTLAQHELHAIHNPPPIPADVPR